RHSRPVSRRGDSSQFITFHHSRGPPPPPRIRHFDTTLRFSPAVPPPRAPRRRPDPRSIPLQINAIGATPTARGGASTHPTEFDTFRHFSTLLSNSVESPIPAAAFASRSHLTWGVSSRWERGCSRLALFRKNVFRTPSTTLSVVPKMMRSDDSGECPSPAAGRVSNGQGKNLDLARMFHLRSQRGATRGPQPMVGEISGLVVFPDRRQGKAFGMSLHFEIPRVAARHDEAHQVGPQQLDVPLAEGLDGDRIGVPVVVLEAS